MKQHSDTKVSVGVFRCFGPNCQCAVHQDDGSSSPLERQSDELAVKVSESQAMLAATGNNHGSVACLTTDKKLKVSIQKLE